MNENFSHPLIDQATQAALVINTDGVVVFCNAKAKHFFNCNDGDLFLPDEIYGFMADDRVLNRNQLPFVRMFIERKTLVEQKFCFRCHQSGAERWVVMSAFPYFDNAEMTHAIVWARDITLELNTEDEMQKLAYFDPLTGLPNRTLLTDRMNQAISRADRNISLMAVGYLDLDDFKPINDLHGHAIGDPTVSASPGIHAEVSERRGLMIQDTSLPIHGEDVDGSFELRSCWSHGSVRKLTVPCSTSSVTDMSKTVDRVLVEVSRRIQRELRPSDTVARLGGDEFVVILADVKTSREIDLVMTRLVTSIARPMTVEKIGVSVSASLGVSIYPGDGMDMDTVLKHADQAMYEAKQFGKNRVHLFSDSGNQQSQEIRETRTLVQEALKNNEIQLFWQPKIDVKTGKLAGAEALVRWNRGPHDTLASDQLLPLVENEDLMIQLGDWITHEAFRQIDEWNRQGLHLICAINIASKQIRDRGFLGHLIDVATEFPGVDTRQVEIEIVEETAMDDMELVHSMLTECKGLGFRISLDDFGTGYSSISHFRKLPIDSVKVDRSFIRDTLIDPEDRSIVEGIISISKAFGRETVAEGVECLETLRLIRNLGCDYAQGYAIARPMSAEDFTAWANDPKNTEKFGNID